MEKLEVDCFEIDIDILHEAQKCNFRNVDVALAMSSVIEDVLDNLTQESKKRFEEYQEKNSPCKGVE